MFESICRDQFLGTFQMCQRKTHCLISLCLVPIFNLVSKPLLHSIFYEMVFYLLSHLLLFFLLGMYALALTFDSFNLQCCFVARFSSSAGWRVVLAEFIERSALETKFTPVCPNPGTVCASWAGQQVQSKLMVLLGMFSLGLTRWGTSVRHTITFTVRIWGIFVTLEIIHAM